MSENRSHSKQAPAEDNLRRRAFRIASPFRRARNTQFSPDVLMMRRSRGDRRTHSTRRDSAEERAKCLSSANYLLLRRASRCLVFGWVQSLSPGVEGRCPSDGWIAGCHGWLRNTHRMAPTLDSASPSLLAPS